GGGPRAVGGHIRFQVELGDAAVAPDLLGLGGQLGSHEARCRGGAPRPEPLRAGKVGRSLRGEGLHREEGADSRPRSISLPAPDRQSAAGPGAEKEAWLSTSRNTSSGPGSSSSKTSTTRPSPSSPWPPRPCAAFATCTTWRTTPSAI